MDAIEAREGLGELECWINGDGPEDYRAAFAEYQQLVEKLTNAFEVKVLRRYGFSVFADLLESDPMRFDVMKEIGSWLRRPRQDPEGIQLRLSLLVKTHGPEAQELFQTLAMQHGLKLPQPSPYSRAQKWLTKV